MKTFYLFTNLWQRSAAVLCLLLAMGVGQMWGATAVYKTALFGSSYNSGNVNNYTSSWYATNNGFRVNLQNFNNNNSGWNLIKCGTSSAASTATIITNVAIDQAITKVSMNISSISNTYVTSITLYTSANGSSWSSAGTFSKNAGNQQVVIASPTANRYYKIEFVCTKGKSNGIVAVNDVKFYYNGASCNSIDVTGGSAVTLPAGSTTYAANDWKNAGSPLVYETVTEYLIGASSYCVSFTQTADYGDANGLQLKASAGILQISGITSTSGVDVEVVIGSGSGISVALTGTTTLTGQSAGTSTISTTSTDAALTISKTTSGAGYIKTIKITPKVACNANPTIGATSITNSPFVLTSLTETVSVNCTGGSTGSATCTWVDRGYVWSLGTTTTTPTVDNNKVAGSNGDQATGWAGWITPSGSTTPTAWEVGKTYYIRAYGKNGKAGAEFAYGTAASFTLRSITFNSNGGSSVGPWYVNSGGTYEAPTAPTRTGYTFDAWYTDNGTFENEVDWSAAVSANKEYFANWTANEYSITLDDEDATSSGSTSVTLTYNSSTHAAITNPTKTGYNFGGWYTGDGGTGTMVINSSGVLQANVDGYTGAGGVWTKDATCTLYALWIAKTYEDYVFSCAELTLEAHLVTEGTPIFITSTANKKVRSQDYIQITGSGLTPSTALTFPGLNSKFEIKTSTGAALRTDASGDIDEAAYIFYTPGAGDTSDGLDKMTGISVSVSGAKQKSVNLTQDIIGRHLPADFVIAGKKNGKWYALPANMASTDHPSPAEIAVDDANDPSIAYTATSNIYGLEGPASGNISDGDGQYVKLTMHPLSDAPLLGQSSPNTAIGKSGTAIATNKLSEDWWWKLQQENTSITNPQDAKYKIYRAGHSSSLSIKNDPFQWGLYASANAVDELRLIPASSVEYTEAEVVAWGQKKLILEIEKPALATQARAKIGGGSWSGNKSLATTTGTSVKGTATQYNYTLDFTFDAFDFSNAANEGKMLIIELLNSGGTPLKASSVVIPRIIAADRTINKTNDDKKTPWDTEVHVLPGVTLTVDASGYTLTTMTIKELNIYPGATVNASNGTLIATTLILRNGWSRLEATKKYDVARLYITPTNGSLSVETAYSDWYVDYDQYYPIAVPWTVTTSGMTYKNTNSAASAGVKMRYYDGASRATNVQTGVGESANWKIFDVDGKAYPATLTPGVGYAMTAKRPVGKAFSIVRMPLTIPDGWTTGGELGYVSSTHKDQVNVTAHAKNDGSTPDYAKGWNFIANPYMSLFKGTLSYAADDDIAYANIPDINFKEYDQVPIDATKALKPSSAFLIQAPKTGTATFATSSRALAAAPSYRNTKADAAMLTQRAYIQLSDEDAEDMMGILVSEKYTAEYELNADLEKLLSDGNTLRTYMRYNNLNMAYLAINEELAKELISVAVRIPADGDYTFKMHEGSVVNELEGVYLTDYETGKVTNLLYNDYTFTAEAGTLSDRFAINAIVGVHTTPTSLDISGADKDGPTKFIYHDKVFILHNGVIYDSTGKRVNEINK